jgi:TolB protein
MDEHGRATDSAQIARRLGLSEQLVRRLQARGALRRFELSEAEIRRRLYEGHLACSSAGRRSDGASKREGKMRKLIVGLAPFLAVLIFASSAAAYETSAKLSEVANVYSLGVGEVRCASETEWNADFGAALGSAYTNVRDEFAVLGPLVCEGALNVASSTVPAWQQALGVLALTHEAFHLRRWRYRRHEGKVECQAMVHFKDAAQRLVASQAHAEDLYPYALGLHERQLRLFPATGTASACSHPGTLRSAERADDATASRQRRAERGSSQHSETRREAMKKFQATAALACVVAVSSALAVGSAFSSPSEQAHVATAPGKNGGIAFKRYLDGGRSTGAIFTVDANGEAERQVTKPEPGVVDDQPDWSPDGSLLVFHRGVRDSTRAIYTVKPDGSDLTRLSPPCSASGPGVETTCEDGEGASFLPDGKHVVYTRATGNERHFPGWDQIQHSDIVVRDVNGANARVLIRSHPYVGDYLSAQFSPDGSRLVYVRSNSPLAKPVGGHALFVARADGSRQRQITPWPLDAGDNPDWSPNGKLILFRSNEGGAKQSQIYVVRPDGTGLRPLTRFKPGTTVLSYSFSPDGKWITFAKSGRGGQPDIFVMRANGAEIQPVTRSALWDSAPDWGAAG